MEKVLITGANGYIGSNLVPALEKGRDFELHLLARKKLQSQHSCYAADLTDFPAIEKIIAKVRPDTVVHLAATGFNYEKKETLEQLIDVNFKATQKLADACAKIGNCRFIYLTTYMECQGSEKPIAAGDRIIPQSPYAQSKSLGTEYLSYMARSGLLDARILRIFSVYGLNDRPFRFIPSVFDALTHNKAIETTSLLQKRDFVYVRDVADAIMLAMKKEKTSQPICNIGSGKATALLDVASKIRALYPDSSGKIKIGAKPERPGEAPIYFADISQTKSGLGWAPNYDLDAGLKETCAYYVKASQ